METFWIGAVLFAGCRRILKLLKNLGNAVLRVELVEIPVDLFDALGVRDILRDGPWIVGTPPPFLLLIEPLPKSAFLHRFCLR